MKPIILLFSVTLIFNFAFGQSSIEDILKMQIAPKLYAVKKINSPIKIDGKDNEKAWKSTGYISDFEDIEGASKKKPAYNTKFKMLWDNQNLYIYAQLKEPHIWSNLTKRDAIIYHNNDFEIFLKPYENDPIYFEIEINALNTVLDLLMTKPYRFDGQALLHWDIKDLQTAVHIEGTNNNPLDIDKYWAVEVAIPFSSLQSFGKKPHPDPLDYWRVNFSRVQWQHDIVDGQYRQKTIKGKKLPEDNWVWQPTGLIDIHLPEQWGFIQFFDSDSEHNPILPKSFPIERFTWNIYYLQRVFHEQTKKYAANKHQLQALSHHFDNDFARYQTHMIVDEQQQFYRTEIKDNQLNITTTIDSEGNYSIRYDK